MMETGKAIIIMLLTALFLSAIPAFSETIVEGKEKESCQQTVVLQKTRELSLPSSSFSKELIKMICGLFFVVCAILILFAVLRKKVSLYGREEDKAIKILEMRPLFGKKSLCLIEVEKRRMVLGITEENISLLCTLDDVKKSSFDTTLQELQNSE